MKMTVEIAPGRVSTVDLNGRPPPSHVIAKLVAVGESGLMRAIPVEWSPNVVLNAKNMKKLGIDLPTYIIRRLILAGLVKGSAATTRVTLVDVASLHEHILATQCNGGSTSFWTQARKEAYVTAYGALNNAD